VRVVICDRCSWPVDYGCTCRTDEVTARARWVAVQRRHAAAVVLARRNDMRRWLEAERERKSAS
jgi:hypothetical protein